MASQNTGLAADVRAEPSALETLVRELFERLGSQPDEAGEIAARLVAANLTGHDSHGVVQAPRYARALHAGELAANVDPEVLADGGAWVHLDARLGFGQHAGAVAMRTGIERARKHGVALVALRRSGHLGRIGDWPEMAAEAGLASLHFVNVTGCVWVAPEGGLAPRLSTNPVAAGVPRANGEHVILDIATSVAAEGKMQVAAQRGEAMPEPAAVDADGRETADPLTIYGERLRDSPALAPDAPGAMLAFGGHKGSGLALISELLGGALTGTGCSRAEPDAASNGMLSLLIDPDRFSGDFDVAGEIERYIAFFTSSAPRTAGGEVLIPGEPERRTRRARLTDGIPLPDATWTALQDTARAAGVAEATIAAARRTGA